MEQRRLGDSDIDVSVIALGSWLTYGGGVGRARTEACTRAAFDAGITFFDTANVYGRGAAERAWGEILRDFPRDSFTIATKLFYPHSADLAARQETCALRSAFVLGNRLSLALALPLCLAFGLLATPVLDAWVGEDFLDAAPVVALLLGAIAVWSVTRIGLLMLQGMGEAKTPALIHLAEAVINVVLSVVLGLAFGLTGVALATLIAAVVANLGALAPFLCRRFGVPLGGWALAAARAHVPPLLVAGAVGVLALSADPEGLVEVTVAVTVVLAAYVLAFAVSGVSRDELRRLRAAIAR